MAQKQEKSGLRKLIDKQGINNLTGVYDFIKEMTSEEVSWVLEKIMIRAFN